MKSLVQLMTDILQAMWLKLHQIDYHYIKKGDMYNMKLGLHQFFFLVKQKTNRFGYNAGKPGIMSS